jgi:Poxvirus Late Transcription Factor VLTF3 like
MRKKKEKHGQPTYSKYHGNGRGAKSKSQHSILARHEKRLADYNNKEERLKKLDSKIQTLRKEHVALSKERSYKVIDNSSLDAIGKLDLRLMAIDQEMRDLELQKVEIEQDADVIEYLLESSNIVQDFAMLDDKEIELLDLSDITREQAQELAEIRVKKARLVDDYLTKFEEGYIPNRNLYSDENVKCTDCDEYLVALEGFSVCMSCGISKHTIEQSGDLSFKELQDYDYRPQFTYEKESHLQDWLRRFQAREETDIPQDVLDGVILEAKKERVQLHNLTEDKVKRYLKKLKLNTYYEHVIAIINRINGRPPFHLTQEVQDKIRTMFQQIQPLFEKHKPPGRKNFMSYSYVLCKFFLILNLPEFAVYFPLLKSPDKLRAQDEIFKKIVADMAVIDKSVDWRFFPSF